VSPRAARLAAAGLAAVLLTLSGCGVGPQSPPVSPGSASPSWAPTGATPGASQQPGTALQIALFLVRDGKLVRAWRPSPQGQDLSAVLAALDERPTSDEKARHLRTAIPATATRIRAVIRDGVALVQVPAGFDTLPNSERVLAVAQVVYTLTAQLPVGSMRLARGKHRLDTPVGSGRLVTRPVTRQDFAALAPGVS
jgi:hypothetical protein